ncbi:MAG: Lrp/AsnC ligand binding domain-containing protein, partial [Blastocatellia bacterium]
LFKEIPEIIECHRVTGDDSLILKVHVTSIAHLETVIQRITPYGMPATSIVLSTPIPKRRLERQMVAQSAKKPRNSQS